MPFAIRPHSSVVALLALPAILLALVAILAGSAGRSNAEQGQYLHFTGPDSGHIEVPDAPALNPTTEITIEAWVFITSGNGWGTDAVAEGCPTFVGKNYTLSYWFGLDCLGSTNLKFYLGGELTQVTSTGAVPVGEWTHIAVTFDGANVRFYINGVLDSTVATANTLGTSTDPLQIGSDFEWDSTPIGHIDEVHIWSVARSQAAVSADMDPITTPQIGLAGVWNMEGTPDANVGGHTGTLVGDAEFSGTPITASPTPEPAYVKGDTSCDHSLTPADALPIIGWMAGINFPLPPCENPISVSSQGDAPDEWWDASSGAGYIEIPDDTELSPTEAITIELWINVWSYLSPDSQNACPSLVGKGYFDSYWLGLCSGYLRFYARDETYDESLGRVPLREWTHVAATADETSIKFYINGELNREVTTDSAPLGTNAQPLRIGSDANYNFQPWAALDDIRIWNVVLTEAQIDELIVSPPSPPQNGLVAYYALDGNAEDTANDHEGGAVGTVEYGTTLPSPYWPDINCSGDLDAGDVIALIADLGGIGEEFPLPNGCEAIGAPTS